MEIKLGSTLTGGCATLELRTFTVMRTGCLLFSGPLCSLLPCPARGWDWDFGKVQC